MPITNNANDPWLPGDPVALNRFATPIAVYRVNGSSLEAMTSLRCLFIEEREGPTPATAAFRYAFDGVDPDSPQSVEEALDVSFTLPKIVKVGDQLAVRATMPDSTTQWIFNGIPIEFGCQLKGDVETVVISCVGMFHRAWDAAIDGSYMRN